jgi:hypothetical protein
MLVGEEVTASAVATGRETGEEAEMEIEPG